MRNLGRERTLIRFFSDAAHRARSQIARTTNTDFNEGLVVFRSRNAHPIEMMFEIKRRGKRLAIKFKSKFYRKMKAKHAIK